MAAENAFFSTKGTRRIKRACAENEPNLYLARQVNPEQIINLNVKLKTIKLIKKT